MDILLYLLPTYYYYVLVCVLMIMSMYLTAMHATIDITDNSYNFKHCKLYFKEWDVFMLLMLCPSTVLETDGACWRQMVRAGDRWCVLETDGAC